MRQIFLSIPNCTTAFDLSLKRLTTMRVGGNADIVCYPKSVEAVKELLKRCKEYAIPFYVLGMGSNVVASDFGFCGAIIRLTSLAGVKVEGNTVDCLAGTACVGVAHSSQQNLLAGAEFLGCIPATIGGAIISNAGCFGYSTADIVIEARATDGFVEKLFKREEIGFSYRHSVFANNGYVVTSAKLHLNKGDERVKDRLEEMRRTKCFQQPLGIPSSGSVFLRQGEVFPAKLIDEAGLKGLTVGGAMVSTKHAGFVVNCGNATATDVFTLVKTVESKIFDLYGIKLEREIKFLGDFE